MFDSFHNKKYKKYKQKYLNLKKIIYNEILGGRNIKKLIRIVVRKNNTGGGKYSDVIFLKNIITSYLTNCEIEIILYDKLSVPLYYDINKVSDYLFYIERIPILPLISKKSYLFVNQEFLYDYEINILKDISFLTNKIYSDSNNINKNYKIVPIIPLCKTKYAQQILKELDINNSIYVGFGNIKYKEIKLKSLKSIDNCFTHLVGRSPLKNTQLVIDTWLKYNDEFKNNYLILTMYDNNLYESNIYKIYNYFCKFNPIITDLPKEIIDICPKDINLPKFLKYKSLYLYLGNLDSSIIKFLYQISGCSICPSAIEGWGHYINEAILNKSLVLTLDAPPMNELIDKKSGILIKSMKGPDIRNIMFSPYYIKQYNKQFDTFTAKDTDLRDAILKVIALDNKTKNKLINNAYKKSIKDAEQFNKNMKKIL